MNKHAQYIRDLCLEQSQKRLNQPLHERVKAILLDLIRDAFNDGDKFYSENDLIKRLGASQPTVRRALQGLTQEGWLEARWRQGYFVSKPEHIRAVGVFMSSIYSEHILRTITTLGEFCLEQSIAVNSYPIHHGLEDAVSHILNPSALEKCITSGLFVPEIMQLNRLLEKRSYSLLSMANLGPNSPISWVAADDKDGVYQALNYLVEMGHKRIAFMLCEPLGLRSIELRLEAFKETAKKLKLSECTIEDGTRIPGSSREKALVKTEELVAQNRLPTAIFAASDHCAFGVMKALMRNEIQIPKDVSVIGFDDVLTSEIIHPALTTIKYPMKESCQEVLRWAISKDPIMVRKAFKPQLITRESVACPRK